MDATLRMLGIDATEVHCNAVRDLNTGECLMRDLHGQVARVQVELDQELVKAFTGNPAERT